LKRTLWTILNLFLCSILIHGFLTFGNFTFASASQNSPIQFIFDAKSFSQSFQFGNSVGVARAQWLNSSTILLRLPPGLYVSSNSTQFHLVDTTLSLREGSSTALPLISVQGSYALLSTSQINLGDLDRLITLPLKIVVTNNTKQILDSTAIQYAGILDERFYYNGDDLGAQCSYSGCVLKIWAPTAKNVRVLFDHQEPLQSQRGSSGVWILTLPYEYKNSFYQYEIQVYQPITDRIETSLVTDPYSKSLSLNGTRSQLVDLNSPETMPAGWTYLPKPLLRSLNDAIIYELHIRDFSSQDGSVTPELRGSYLAFTEAKSSGVRHLRALADAGLTHLHLMPFNDFGSVNEDKKTWENYSGLSSNLQEPQSVIGGIKDTDPFNWGYDPVHYFAPEGSYAVNGEGASRLREVRSMVQSINGMGLRIVQDVVFNHTFAGGLEPYSVFDKIVPLYYYRLDDQGNAMNTSCCRDTASEHRMMEKLMIDSVVSWAKNFKIDGFRFDLISFHSKSTMIRLKDTLRALDIHRDGVDGSKILIYGEGWSFGSFFDRYPHEAMTLENSAGSEIGLFNDRLRDAIRGGTTNSSEKSDQGFATGLYFDFNQEPANRNTPTDLTAQKDKILHLGDVIKVGLAGNLKDFKFKEHLGSTVRGGDLRFRETAVGCAEQAIETINYVSIHDGYTLWDSIAAKAPFYTQGRNPMTASADDRQRMQQLAMAIPLLGQGLPIFEAGTEVLRSKNGDQDSYNSGDFFNRIDWTGTTNNWGRGLPPAWKNLDDWNFWRPRLVDSQLQITQDQIVKTNTYFKALLRVRQSSDLFKLNTLEKITLHLSFIDNEDQAEPGLIVMRLENSKEKLLIMINASREARLFRNKSLQASWILHPYFDAQVDSRLSEVVLNPTQNSVQIPGRTTVVLTLQSTERSHQ
jgi:pullulanase